MWISSVRLVSSEHLAKINTAVEWVSSTGRSSRAGLGGVQGREEHTKQEGSTKGREKDSKDSIFSFKIILRASPRSRRGKEHFLFLLLGIKPKPLGFYFYYRMSFQGIAWDFSNQAASCFYRKTWFKFQTIELEVNNWFISWGILLLYLAFYNKNLSSQTKWLAL